MLLEGSLYHGRRRSTIRLVARRLKSRATGSEARLRGLGWAIPDSFRKNHQPRATGSEARLRGLGWAIPDYFKATAYVLKATDL